MPPAPVAFIEDLSQTLRHGPMASAGDHPLRPAWGLASWNHTPAMVATKRYDCNTLVFQFGGGTRVERRKDGITTHSGVRVGSVTTCPAHVDLEFDVHETVQVVHLYFDGNFVAEAVGAEDAGRVAPVPELFSGDNSPLQALMEALRVQLHAGTWSSPAGAVGLDHTVRATVAHVAQGLSRETLPRTTRVAQGRLARVADYVDAHLDAHLSVRELAALTGLTVEHFSRSFKAHTGLSPHAWIQQRRIAAAQALLDRTALPVALVALRTGFASDSHFVRAFRARVGVTPGEYRRQRRS